MYRPISQSHTTKQNTLADSDLSKEWQREKLLKLVRSINDPRFGSVDVVKDTNNHILFTKSHIASSKAEASDELTYLRLRTELNNRHVLRLVGYSSLINKDLCSTTYYIKAFYEFPKTDLFKENYERNKKSQDFSASDLAHIAYQTLSALHNLHVKDIVHGDIRPMLIGYDRSHNHYELLDRIIDPSPLERCQSNHIVNNKELYMSPELYKKLKGNDKMIIFDPAKNDIFALGLVILNLGIRKSVQNIYLPSGEIGHRFLQEHVMNFDLKYNAESPFICALVKALLQMSGESRLDARSLFPEMPSYAELVASDADNSGSSLKFGYQPLPNEPFSGKDRVEVVDKETNYVSRIGKSSPPKHPERKDEPKILPTLNSTLGNSTPLHTYSTYTVPPENFNNTYHYYGDHSQFINSTHLNLSNTDNTHLEYRRNASKSPNKVISKRRYVMKENGDVIEVDPSVKLNNEKIKEYFSSGHKE